MKLILLFLAFGLSALANIENAPEPFQTAHGRAIFVDFIKAEYNLLYDFESEEAFADTEITFRSYDRGLPIFDSVNTPLGVSLNGVETEQALVYVPGNVSRVRIALREVG